MMFSRWKCYSATSRDKAKLVAYQLKDVAQVLFEQWRIETRRERSMLLGGI